MSTFLELCQRVASESGTVNGALPAAVTGQTGRLAKIVGWTNDGWRSIQLAHGSWRWMRGDFTSTAIASGTRAYSATDLSITRFGEFLLNEEHEDRYSVYLTATGVSDERPLRYMSYDRFFTTCMRGAQTNAYPAWFTITPDNKIALHPIPDASYTLRGPYQKAPQELAANTDEPEMPARFHHLIADVALQEYLGAHDEASTQIPLWRLRKLRGFTNLERDQLPRIRFGGPLA
jgi:hypothetical protein